MSSQEWRYQGIAGWQVDDEGITRAARWQSGAKLTEPINRYSVFGLQIDSELELPELYAGQADRSPDVTIRVRKIPLESGRGTGVHPTPAGALLVIEEAGRFLVEGGIQIIVEPSHAASVRNVRLFLLGSAFGLLLHQRGLLPLHANAVEIESKVVAFMGASGAGKSTLTSWFANRGFPLIADDVSVVDFSAAMPVVQPGLPRIRLRPEVLEAHGEDPGDYPLSFEGDGAYDKRDVLLPLSRTVTEPRQIGALVELAREGPLIKRLQGAEAAEVIISHTYRGAFVRPLRLSEAHWRMCMRLVERVPVYRAAVNFDLEQLDRTYEPLVAAMKVIVAGNFQVTSTRGDAT